MKTPLSLFTNALQHRYRAGFMHSGCAELMLVGYVLAALLNLVFGNWKIAAAMLVPVAGLFVRCLLAARWSRCKLDDLAQVIPRPHPGMQATIAGRDETGAKFMVQASAAEHEDSVKIHVNHLEEAQRKDVVNPSR